MNERRRFMDRLKRSVSDLMAPAQDPRQVFVDAFERQRILLNNIRRAARDLTTARARLEQQIMSVRGRLPELDAQAELAVSANREDLARLALRRRYIAGLQLQELERQVGDIQVEEARLVLAEQRLAAQLESLSARQQVAAARHTAADAEMRILGALAGVSDELADLGLALERTEQQTEEMKAHASAIDHLVGEGFTGGAGLGVMDPLERALDEREMAEAIEEQLRALRRREEGYGQ